MSHVQTTCLEAPSTVLTNYESNNLASVKVPQTIQPTSKNMSRTDCGAEEAELVLSGPTLWNRKTSKPPLQNSFTVFLLSICVAKSGFSFCLFVEQPLHKGL